MCTEREEMLVELGAAATHEANRIERELKRIRFVLEGYKEAGVKMVPIEILMDLVEGIK